MEDSRGRAPSATLRVSTLVAGAANAGLGVILFFAPRWSAQRIPWKVTAFMAMTIGAYALGNAWMAFVAVRAGTWSRAFPLLLYVWAFGGSELGVVIWFRHVFKGGAQLAWPYLVALALTVLAALVGLFELARSRPALRPADERPNPVRIQAQVTAFVVALAFLAAVAIGHPHSGTTRTIFPEVLSPFTIRVFGTFYLSLAVGAAAVWWIKRLPVTIAFIRGGLGILVPTLGAGLVYIGRFDFSAHPGQVVYLGAYAFVLVMSVVALGRTRVG